jgi:hypothetical protein
LCLYSSRSKEAPYLERAIGPVLAQQTPPDEINVDDDSSADCGADFVNRLSGPRVRLIVQQNAGPGAARDGIHFIEPSTPPSCRLAPRCEDGGGPQARRAFFGRTNPGTAKTGSRFGSSAG